jgi:hypothetical protein
MLVGMSTPTTPKNTNGFYVQAGVAFAVALLTMIFGIYVMPGDIWVRAFLGLGTIFLTTSSFTLAKCVRDAQEEQYVLARIDRARLDKLLAEHDPFQPHV